MALIGAFVLSGCEDAAPLVLTAPGVAATAPIGGAMVLAEGPGIRQPVLVKSASDVVLTPPFEGRTKARFTVDQATVVCTGKHDLRRPTVVFDPGAEGGYSTYYKIPLTCNKSLKGLAFVSIYPARGDVYPMLHFEVGPEHVPLRPSGGPGNRVLGQATFTCFNEFSTRYDPVSPFGVKCRERAYGVAAQNAVNQSSGEFTLWIFPSS